MDEVFRFVKKDAEDPESEEIVDVLYKGTRDKVEAWLRSAVAAPTATHVLVGDFPMTIEEYWKLNTK
jgi:hypothetical protein